MVSLRMQKSLRLKYLTQVVQEVGLRLSLVLIMPLIQTVMAIQVIMLMSQV